MPSQRPFKSALSFLLLLSFPLLAAGQPTGSEPRTIRAIVQRLQDRIAVINQQIAQEPDDAKAYAARGSLYIEIYRALVCTDPPLGSSVAL